MRKHGVAGMKGIDYGSGNERLVHYRGFGGLFTYAPRAGPLFAFRYDCLGKKMVRP
jgi:hypothetical protein